MLRLERGRSDSPCDSIGAEFYDAAMTDDALMILANGETMTRADVVTALAKSGQGRPTSCTTYGSPLNADAAAPVYVGVAHRVEDDEPFVGAMSSTLSRTSAPCYAN